MGTPLPAYLQGKATAVTPIPGRVLDRAESGQPHVRITSDTQRYEIQVAYEMLSASEAENLLTFYSENFEDIEYTHPLSGITYLCVFSDQVPRVSHPTTTHVNVTLYLTGEVAP